MNSTIKKELKSFKLQIELPVRWGEMDAFQHVNNTVYIKWVEQARVEYLRQHIIENFKSGSLGPILARQDIRYIFPITYPDTVIIGFKVIEIQEDRLLCESKIYSKKYERLSAIAYNTIMAYDFTGLRKADIPVDWVSKIQELED